MRISSNSFHQNKTKKNINFLEKRESPKRTFSFYIEYTFILYILTNNNHLLIVLFEQAKKKRPPKKRAALYRKISVLKSVSADAAVRLI